MHQCGAGDTKQQAFPQAIGAFGQPALQRAASEGAEPIFQMEHPQHEQGNTRRQGGQLGFPDEQKGEYQQNHGYPQGFEQDAHQPGYSAKRLQATRVTISGLNS